MYRKEVSELVSVKFGIRKVSESVSEKFGIEKGTGIGIENIWYWKKCIDIVNILGHTLSGA